MRKSPPTKGKGKTANWMREHIRHEDPKCLIWPFFRNPNGYGQIGFEGKMHYTHRLMCEMAHGAPPTPKHEAAHKCGNGHQGCVNPKHLAWKTKAENRRESNQHGKGARSPHGNRGKLTPAAVAEIMALKGTMRQIDIAARYNVSWQTISGIYCGRHHTGNSKITHWEPEENEKLRDALQNGMTFTQAAALIGKKKSAVVSHAYRLGLSSKSGHHACKNL